jgi:phage terminase small subunit
MGCGQKLYARCFATCVAGPHKRLQCPQPPSFLSSYAQDEWWRHGLGLLSAIDVAYLAAYCQAHARWREAEETLARMGARDEQVNALLPSGPAPFLESSGD